jgi:hypothetical protein
VAPDGKVRLVALLRALRKRRQASAPLYVYDSSGDFRSCGKLGFA